MHLSELLNNFPWANHPIIRTFAPSFSAEQWQSLTAAGMDKLTLDINFSDENLLQLLMNIHEVANKEEVVEMITSGKMTFEKVAELLVTEQSNQTGSSRSAINYLLSMGFEKNILNEFFSSVDINFALEKTNIMASISLNTDITEQEKIAALQQIWKDSIYPLNLLCKPHSSSSEILNYLANELTYEEFVKKATSKQSALFKSNPGREDFAALKKESLAVVAFFNYCEEFISQQSMKKLEL